MQKFKNISNSMGLYSYYYILLYIFDSVVA